MLQIVQKILAEKNIRSHTNEGILICNVDNALSGLELAKDILYAIVDKTTVLYLSGGRTPKELYEVLAKEEKLHPGGVGLVDERFGEKFHENSNEKMLKDTGLLRYLNMLDIKFYPILHVDKSREEAAEMYDDRLRSFLAAFQKHIAILGVGMDGHTAGIAGNRPDFQNPMFSQEKKSLLVSEFDDPKGTFKKRITMTFLGLSMMDLLLVLIFGEDKQKALDLMFSIGFEEEIPASFFKRADIAKKTVFITDQTV